MIIDPDDLTTPLTADEIEASIYQVIAAAGTDHTVWTASTVMRVFIRGVAIVLAAMSNLSSLVARGAYLEKAEGAWLTLLAYYVYNVLRQSATFATGSVTLTNTGGGSYTEAAEAVTFTDPSTGKEFVNTEALSLSPFGSATIAVRAKEAGSASTALAGGISEISSPAMSGVTCTNAAALLAYDDETDAFLRVRCREKLGSLSPMGPWDAYSYAAKTALRADGTLAGITRVATVRDGYGNVTAYVANATGPVSGTIGDTSTDLGAADEAMQRRAVPQGITLNTLSATGLTVDVVGTVYVYDHLSLTDAQLKTLVLSKVAEYMKARPIGGDKKPGGTGYVFEDGIKGAISSARPEIYDVDLVSVITDIDVVPGEVPVLGAFVISVVRVNLESLQS